MKNKLVSVDNNFTLDKLPCGALVTNAEHVILEVNDYFVGIEASLLVVMSKVF